MIFVLALAVRLAIVARSDGGPLGNFGYDSSVYYSAADALIHGRMPYASFTLLHPPALMLILAPFAYLGTISSDHTGFVVANTAFEALGALNAALVVNVARRAGVGRLAALGGGLFYALWPGAAGAEISARLEPLGNFFLLCGLLLLVPVAHREARRGRTLLGGALLGAAAVTKIWWIIPLLILAVWTAHRDRRAGGVLLAGASLSTILLAGPFFARSPLAMWRMVVTDQLGRPAIGGSISTRLSEMTSLDSVIPGPQGIAAWFLPVVLGILMVLALLRAWTLSALRPIIVVAVAQLLVLLTAPTYFGFYADYLAPGAALLLAGNLSAFRDLAHPKPSYLRRLAVVTSFAAITASAAVEIAVAAPSAIAPFPGTRLAQAVSRAHLRCVMADSPMALIELNVLTQDFRNGCPNRIDVSGSTYDIDRPRATPVPRRMNIRWQHDLYGYLLSGDAEIVIRRQTGISTPTQRLLDRLPVIARIHGIVLRRTP